jgi:thioredoxin-like negative regulator of GroEL
VDEEKHDLVLARVDMDEFPDIAAKYEVKGM